MSVDRDDVPCKGCGAWTAGFKTNGYCEDCLCDECGTTLESEEERAMHMCFDCDEQE